MRAPERSIGESSLRGTPSPAQLSSLPPAVAHLLLNRPTALQNCRRAGWCCSMGTPYSFSAFPREPPKYPVINEDPTPGAVIANFGAEDVGRIFGTAAVGAVWGFVWGAPETARACLVPGGRV